MRQVAHSLYLLPGRFPKERPYKSSWKMTAEQAAALGALYPIPGTAEMRPVPETEEERLRVSVAGYPSAGHDGVRPPRG